MVAYTPAEATSGVVLSEANTKAFSGNKDHGIGTLTISENVVSWESDTQTFTIRYQDLSIYAISRDTQSFPYECLFCLLSNNSEFNDDSLEVEDTQFYFVPSDSSKLQMMYDAITECQALHPDPNDSMSDDDDFVENDELIEEEVHYGAGDDLAGFYTADSNFEDIELSEEGMANLQRLQENMRIMEEEKPEEDNTTSELNGDNMLRGQFDDADGMD